MVDVSTDTILSTLGITNHKIIYTANATEDPKHNKTKQEMLKKLAKLKKK